MYSDIRCPRCGKSNVRVSAGTVEIGGKKKIVVTGECADNACGHMWIVAEYVKRLNRKTEYDNGLR